MIGRRYLLRLIVEGFGSFGGKPQTFDLDFRGRILVVGENKDADGADSNGSGKSNLLRALAWCLYEQQSLPTGLAVADVINLGTSFCEVTLFLDVGDGTERYAIRRQRSAKKTSLSLYTCNYTLEELLDDTDIDGFDYKNPDVYREISLSGKAAMQSYIEDVVLGMDWERFRSTTFFAQGDHHRFSSSLSSDAARKQLLRAILDLDTWSVLKESTKDLIVANKTQTAELESRLQAHAKKLRKCHDKIIALEARLKELQAQDITLEGDIEECSRDFEKATRKLKEETALLSSHATAMSDCEAVYERHVQDCNELIKKREDNRRKLVSINGVLDALCSGEDCPHCLRPPSDGDSDLIAYLEGEKAKVLKRLCGVKLKLEGRIAARESSDKELTEWVSACRDQEKKVSLLEAKLSEIKKRRDTYEDLWSTLSSKIRETEEELKAAYSRREHEVSVVRNYANQIGFHTRRGLHLSWWASRGFGPRGIEALCIEERLPLLNNFIAGHLEALTENTLQASWYAFDDSGFSSKAKDFSLGCKTFVEGVEGRPLSGGQARKLELATSVSLSQLHRLLHGIDFDTLFIDECFEGLDHEASVRVAEWLESLPFRTIVVVSHSTSITDAFDRQVVVVKQGGISIIKEIA